MEADEKESLEREIMSVLNRHCAENESNTPDHILAEYLMGCLQVWNAASTKRDRWWGHEPKIGGTAVAFVSPVEPGHSVTPVEQEPPVTVRPPALRTPEEQDPGSGD